LATIALCKVENPISYGVAVLENEKIIKFLEKPKSPPTSYINSGLYVLSPKIKKYFSNKDYLMLEDDLFPILAQERKLLGYKWEGRWQDMGTFERWEKAIKNWR
ncbi:MAG: nucleotidyltransferase family protein, partial [Candidatus Woesearchaeota archaeon]